VSTFYEQEMREQPAVARRLITEGRAGVEAIAAAIRARQPDFAVLAARGSSDNAARYGQYLLGIHDNLIAALATPSIFTQYHATPNMRDAVVVGISQSGQSPDIVEVLREARKQGGVTVAVTNEPQSPLAQAAELVLPLRAGSERSVAATKTYVAQVTAMAMLSAALRADPTRAWADLERLPDLLERTLQLNDGSMKAAARFHEPTRLIVVGRGYNLSTAFEITLKVKETTGIVADGYSSADFLHGPKTLIDESFPVFLVAPGRNFADLDEVAALAKEKGATLIAVSDRQDMLDKADVALPLPDDTPEWLSPIVGVVPGQMWALAISLARGRNPDAPFGLTKVTHTR
jgi:glutamine---fructose-6-phosphate transaminase (isomerizing)